MKYVIVFVVVVAVAAALGLGVNQAFAQGPTPTPQSFWGHGPMMGWGWPGMAEWHNAMQEALAKVLGLSVDQLYAQLRAGKSVYQIAQEKGISPEQFQKDLLAAHKAILDKAVSDGKLTREQADWMQSHMGTCLSGNGYGMMGGAGYGYGMMSGAGFGYGMMGGFGPWNAPRQSR